MTRAWLLIGLGLGLAGCAGAEAHTGAHPAAPLAPATAEVIPPTPLDPGDAGLHAGESMTFEVHVGGLLAGEAQLAVGQAGTVDGHHAVVVKSRAATAGALDVVKHVVDETTTTIDLDSGRALTVDSVAEQGRTQFTAHAVFGPGQVKISYAKDQDAPKQLAVATTGLPVLDMHAAMGQVRGWRPTPGATRTVYVIGGKRLWRIDLRYVGEQAIGTALGNRRAIQIDGQAFHAHANLTLQSPKAERTFSVWLSDDADRVPLKVTAHTELGDIAIELTDYQRGAGSAGS